MKGEGALLLGSISPMKGEGLGVRVVGSTPAQISLELCSTPTAALNIASRRHELESAEPLFSFIGGWQPAMDNSSENEKGSSIEGC